MPIELPNLKPEMFAETGATTASEPSRGLTVGKIALAVFLGNLLTGIVGAAIWMIFNH